LNGRRSRESELRDLFRAVADPQALSATGGFLFRAHFPPPGEPAPPERVGSSRNRQPVDKGRQSETASRRVFFGIVPVITETQRNYHFSIRLGTKALPQVVGGFEPDGTVQALCPPPEGHSWKDDELPLARFQMDSLCDFLVGFGYPSSPFDWITLKWFADAGLYGPHVRTVGDAATSAGSRGSAHMIGDIESPVVPASDWGSSGVQ
jgi:hypothetical protein